MEELGLLDRRSDELFERRIISALIQSEDARNECRLQQDHFTDEASGAMFAIIKALMVRSSPVNIATIIDEAIVTKVVDPGEDVRAIEQIAQSAGLHESWKDDEAAIIRSFQRRSLHTVLSEAKGMLHTGDSNDVRAYVLKQLFDQELTGSTSDLQTSTEVAIETAEYLKRDIFALPTSVNKLDRDFLNGGMVGGQLVIIGARPGSGKSILGCQIASHLASLGIGAAVICVEMSAVQLCQRFKTHMKQEEFCALPLSFKCGSASIEDVERLTRVAVKRYDAKCVVVDYLQLLTPAKGTGRENREQQVADMSFRLKMLAMNLDIPVVCLAQLNRQSGDIPQLSNLRESGAIENNADVVILMSKQDDDGSRQFKKIIVNVAKNRNGETGIFDMLMEGSKFRMVPMPIEVPNFE